MPVKQSPTTPLQRVRLGSGLNQTEAAERAGVTRSTLAVWEGAHANLSTKRFNELVIPWARGTRAAKETQPRYLVAFEFIGQRFLSDGDGRVFVFTDAQHAVEQAEKLETFKLTGMAVLPVWRSGLEELVGRGAQLHVYEDEADCDPTAAVLAYALQLAEDWVNRFTPE